MNFQNAFLLLIGVGFVLWLVYQNISLDLKVYRLNRQVDHYKQLYGELPSGDN
jgi:hypothetical protein